MNERPFMFSGQVCVLYLILCFVYIYIAVRMPKYMYAMATHANSSKTGIRLYRSFAN